MDRELAQLVALVSERSCEDISALVSIMKEDGVVDDELSLAIATVVYDIKSEIIGRVFEKFPDIREEMGRRLDRFGRSHF